MRSISSAATPPDGAPRAPHSAPFAGKILWNRLLVRIPATTSLFGGLPATGAIARTATNIRGGGRTPVAGIIHALTILGGMALAAPLAGSLAMPALAGLLIHTAWNMSEPHKWRGYLAGPTSDKMLLGLTQVLTVITDLTIAIGVGMALGLALRLRRRDIPPPTGRPPSDEPPSPKNFRQNSWQIF